MALTTFKNFNSLHGLLLGMVRGLGFAGDVWLGSPQGLMQGILEGVQQGAVTLAAQSSQALGFAITYAVTQFTTVASSSYAVLPPAVLGMTCTIIHDGSNNLQVCGSAATSDTIDAVATATGVTLTAGRRAV